MKDIGNGWVEGNVQELLGLTDAEAAYVEAKAALTRAVRDRRIALGLTQAEMAKALGTSQSRFSFIEKGDPSVSIDLTLRALFETGLSVRAAAVVMAGGEVPKPRRCVKTQVMAAGKSRWNAMRATASCLHPNPAPASQQRHRPA